MSSQEIDAALKIQEAWSKYQDTKETCAVCMNIIGKDCCVTECGHKFCTGCLLKSVQRNGSCPLCRKKLVNSIVPVNSNNYDYDYDEGYQDGYEQAREELNTLMREEIDIATQQAYDDGIVSGRSIADEDIRLLKEKIDKSNKKLGDQRLNHYNQYKSIENRYNELEESYEDTCHKLDKKDEEIKRLTDRLNILLRNPFVEKLYRETVL